MWANRMYSFGALNWGTIAAVTLLSLAACIGVMYGARYQLPLLLVASIVFDVVLIGAACFLSSAAVKLTLQQPQADAELTHLTRLALAGQISASIVHEITQPISAILLNIEALEFWFASKNGNSAAAESILNDLKRDQTRTREMMARLRSFFSKGELRSESIDMNDLVTHAVELLQPDLKNGDVAVELDLAQETLCVAADRVHLQQVLITLIVNAVEAMATIPVNARVLQISSHCIDRRGAEIVVSDTGPEMTQQQFDHAFDPFFTTKESSMGLGLAVAQSIVAAHRGVIWIERRPQGARFHVEIPMSQTS